jgi:hypothetical protein
LAGTDLALLALALASTDRALALALAGIDLALLAPALAGTDLVIVAHGVRHDHRLRPLPFAARDLAIRSITSAACGPLTLSPLAFVLEHPELSTPFILQLNLKPFDARQKHGLGSFPSHFRFF